MTLPFLFTASSTIHLCRSQKYGSPTLSTGSKKEQADMTVALNHLIRDCQPGLTLPQPFYTDAAIFERDMERVFRRHWILAGLELQIPDPGDYHIYTLGQDEI